MQRGARFFEKQCFPCCVALVLGRGGAGKCACTCTGAHTHTINQIKQSAKKENKQTRRRILILEN